MKTYFRFLLLFTLLTSFHEVQGQNKDTVYYTIRLGAFENPQPADFKTIRPLGYLYAKEAGKNSRQIYMGGFYNKTQATTLLGQVKEKGYSDAVLVEKKLDPAKTVYVIQIASKKTSEPISWESYQNAGTLYTWISDNVVRIVTGPYSDSETARQYLDQIKAAGFADAFTKVSNSALLNHVSTFESGLPETIVPASTPEIIPPAEAIPSPATARKEAPAVKIKRHAALELQKALKAASLYTGSLDGIYAKGTQQAYDKAVKQERRLRNYALISNKMPVENPFDSFDEVQLLKSVAYDLFPGNEPEADSQALVLLQMLYNTTHPLDDASVKRTNDWNTSLWKGLDKWAAKDPLHSELCNVLKIAFYGAQIRIEDYFIEKGLEASDATPLALGVLEQLSDKYLESYLE